MFDTAHRYAVLGERKPKKLFMNEFRDLFFAALPMAIIVECIKVFKTAHVRMSVPVCSAVEGNEAY